jgi:hypothetical protein
MMFSSAPSVKLINAWWLVTGATNMGPEEPSKWAVPSAPAADGVLISPIETPFADGWNFIVALPERTAKTGLLDTKLPSRDAVLTAGGPSAGKLSVTEKAPPTILPGSVNALIVTSVTIVLADTPGTKMAITVPFATQSAALPVTLNEALIRFGVGSKSIGPWSFTRVSPNTDEIVMEVPRQWTSLMPLMKRMAPSDVRRLNIGETLFGKTSISPPLHVERS